MSIITIEKNWRSQNLSENSDQYIVLVAYNTYNFFLEFLLLFFCSKVTLRGCILNICDVSFSKFK